MTRALNKIYFAGSIRGGRDDRELYLQIIEMLSRHGTVLTEHIGNSAITQLGEEEPEKQIHDRDMMWLRGSTVVVAEVTTPSLGVGYELARAVELGKPVLCLFRPSADRSLSAMIMGCSDLKVVNYRVVSELESVFARFFEELSV